MEQDTTDASTYDRHNFPDPLGYDECDCEDKCPKCGKKKRRKIIPWCKTEPDVIYTLKGSNPKVTFSYSV